MRSVALVMCGLALPSMVAARPTLSDAAKKRRIRELYGGYKKELGKFPEITVKELLEAKRRGQRVTLVDARHAREQRVSIIPGAIRARELLKRRPVPRAGLVVVYCTIGYRSARLVQKLRRQGVDARNLVGGILSWTHHDQPLRRGDRRTRRLHVYGAAWDLAKSGTQTVY